jgi:cell wall-associated NlpC family hydrolase
MKKLIIISVIALMTATYFAVASTADYVNSPTQTIQKVTENQQVTKQAPIINYPVKEEVVFTGPVKVPEISSGPVLRSDPPVVGSHDWMAQEKAERDKLESEAAQTQEELEAEIARLEKIANDTTALNETLVLVKKQIGITRWVLGGATPRAWDCSGLVTWTYSQLGIELRHSATSQRSSGTIVTEPKVGDLVSFNHKGRRDAYHIGIYLGPDEMLHSGGKPGDRTEVRSISGWAADNWGSDIVYTRIIETNN